MPTQARTAPKPIARPQRRPTRTAPAPDRPLVISLCDRTGVWCRPYAEAGFEVLQLDLSSGEDVRDFEWPGRPVYGILAAPPCTAFSRARGTVADQDDIREALSVADACIRIIVACRPKFWAIENPPGQLDRFLGPPAFSFQPCDYGDPWTKRTYLWGCFNRPQARPIIPTANGVSGKNGDPALGWSADDRSRTPACFARAFYEANSSGVALADRELWAGEGALWSTRRITQPKW